MGGSSKDCVVSKDELLSTSVNSGIQYWSAGNVLTLVT